MTKYTVEEINGVPYTVVWHIPQPNPSTLGYRLTHLKNSSVCVFAESQCLSHIATALPPLPRNPTAEDAALLYLYAAHGLYVFGEFWAIAGGRIIYSLRTFDIIMRLSKGNESTITHAITATGERVGIPIKE